MKHNFQNLINETKAQLSHKSFISDNKKISDNKSSINPKLNKRSNKKENSKQSQQKVRINWETG
jgi:hypothetical protein